ncbi:hypothetical protein SNEBB_007712 [Seison nebaliae]|nr:hypothetical protein SNEBB_007712 [Seison nebaliae]
MSLDEVDFSPEEQAQFQVISSKYDMSIDTVAKHYKDLDYCLKMTDDFCKALKTSLRENLVDETGYITITVQCNGVNDKLTVFPYQTIREIQELIYRNFNVKPDEVVINGLPACSRDKKIGDLAGHFGKEFDIVLIAQNRTEANKLYFIIKPLKVLSNSYNQRLYRKYKRDIRQIKNQENRKKLFNTFLGELETTLRKEFPLQFTKQNDPTFGELRKRVHQLIGVRTNNQLFRNFNEAFLEEDKFEVLAQDPFLEVFYKPRRQIKLSQLPTSHYRLEVLNNEEISHLMNDILDENFSDEETSVEQLPSTGTIQRLSLFKPYCEIKDQPMETIMTDINSRFHTIYESDLFLHRGSLKSAVEASCSHLVKDRRLLIIYMNHNDDITHEIFCRRYLGTSIISETILNNFVFWMWDVSSEDYKKRFLSEVDVAFSSHSLDKRKFTNSAEGKQLKLWIIGKIEKSFHILRETGGDCESPTALKELLTDTVEIFTSSTKFEAETQEKEEESRQLVKEQNDAYNVALRIDQQRKREQEEKIRAIEKKKRETEELSMKEKVLYMNQRSRAFAALPALPTSTSNTIVLRFQFNGQDENQARQDMDMTGKKYADQSNGKSTAAFVERSFSKTDKISNVLDFLIIHGFLVEFYDMKSNYPTRVMNNINLNDKLEDYYSRKEIVHLVRKD